MVKGCVEARTINESKWFEDWPFVSPHCCFRERVQIDGEYISQDETARILMKF